MTLIVAAVIVPFVGRLRDVTLRTGAWLDASEAWYGGPARQQAAGGMSPKSVRPVMPR